MRTLHCLAWLLLPAPHQDSRPQPDLLAELRAPDQRVYAAYALAQRGAAAVPGLLVAAADPEPAVRRWAIWSLGQVGTGAADAVPHLRTALDDPWTEPWAVEALARIGAPAVTALCADLGDNNRRHCAAAIALARMPLPQAHQAVLPVLLADLGDPRRAALAAVGLCALGAAAEAELTRLAGGGGFAAARAQDVLRTLRSPDARRRTWTEPPTAERVRAVWARWYAPGDPLPRLLADLARGEPWLRRATAWELHKRGEPADRPRVVAALRQTLTEPDLRPAAATALARLGEPVADLRDALLAALTDDELRAAAADALTTMPGDAARVVPAVLEQLLVGARFGAGAELLTRLGPLPDAAVPIVCDALRDARAMAGNDALALCDLVSAARPARADAMPALTLLLQHRTPHTAAAAADRLGAFGRRAPAAAPALVQALEGPPPLPAHAAVALLSVAPTAEPTLAATPRLLALLELSAEERFAERWPAGSQRIARLFLATGAARVPALRAVLTGGDAALRARACLVLGRLRPDGAAAADELLACLAAREPELHIAASWALGALRAAPERALPALLARLPDTFTAAAPPWQYCKNEEGGEARFATEHTVAWAVTRYGHAASALLLRRLRTAEGADTAGTVWLLGMLGPDAAAAAPALVPLLRSHADPVVRRTAAWALEAIGPQRVFSPVSELTRALADPPVRPVAIHALAAFALSDPAAIKALVAALPEEPPMFGGLRATPPQVQEPVQTFGVSLHVALLQLGDRVVPALRDQQEHGDPAASAAARDLLTTLERWQRKRGK